MNEFRTQFIALLALFILTAVISCGSGSQNDAAKQQEPADELASSPIAQYLPPSFEMGGERVSAVIPIREEQLAGLIKDAEDILNRYDCQGGVAATYRSEVTEVRAEILRFLDQEKAFGLYSALRLSGVQPLDFDVEGFTSESEVLLIKEKNVVRLVPVDPEQPAPAFAYKLALALNEIIPGGSSVPASFGLFPDENLLPHSERIYADSFLGHEGISGARTVKYVIDADTVTLFMADDSSGGKYFVWYSAIQEANGAVPSTVFEFDSGYSLRTNDGLYGEVVAGLKAGKLCGMLNFSDKHGQFLADWLATIKSGADQ